ncbi:MAG TPA: hypothetical protein VFP10_05265, partial [Candidatus Eisenbacteria bacterium]|nr:hypothetical protein [Candidatus Eisenbacteria bacterium]
MNRAHSWSHAFWAVAGLFLYLLAFLHQSDLAGLPPHFDANLQYPLTLNGTRVASAGEAHRLAEGHAVGSQLEIRDTNGRVVQVSLPNSRTLIERITILVSGLLCWGVSLFLLAPRRNRSGIRELTWGIFWFGFSVVVGGTYIPRDPVWLGVIFNLLQIGCLVALPMLFISIALRFLRPSPVLTRMPWLM